MLSFLNSNAKEKYPLECERIEKGYDWCECDFALVCGTLVARLFDDGAGYMLTYPLPVAEGFSVEGALSEITEYCKREGIQEVIAGVDADALGALLLGVRHAELHAMDAEGRSFVVEIKNELSMLDGDVSFCACGLDYELPTRAFASEYALLVRDTEHNRYYGYEITDDLPDATPAEMVGEAVRELELCRALTLFASDDGQFVGEGVIYNFDGRGGAELSFRVCSALCGRGYGRKILSALVDIAGQIGLVRLFARVHNENLRSLYLVKSQGFEVQSREDGVCYFTLDLLRQE